MSKARTLAAVARVNIPIKRHSCLADLCGDSEVALGQIVDTVDYYAGWAISLDEPLGGNRYIVVSAATGTHDGGSHIDLPASGLQAKALFPNNEVRPEQFGLIGDYVFTPHSGTDNTVQCRRMFNYAAIDGKTIRLSAGKKYLTDSIYLYNDATLNPDYPSRAGRIRIQGAAMGLATGDIEPQGCGFAHINGSAGKLFEVGGRFSFTTAGSAGSMIEMDNMVLIGGDTTADVLFIEGSEGQMSFKNMIIRGRNPAGNGVTEATTWATTWENVLIRGDADSVTPIGWTGIGLNITASDKLSGGSPIADGQNNMKVYRNVEVYKFGRNIEIGRKAVDRGTFAPLVFIGGQASQAEHHNLILGGGAYACLFLGWQSEGAYKNGIFVDRNDPVTANDLPRSNKFISCYLTNNGKIVDGSSNEFQVCVKEGDGVEFDSMVLNNSNSGFYIDVPAGANNVLIRRPLFRTVTAYGQANGTGIKVVTGGALSDTMLENPTFNQNFSVNVDDTSGALAIAASGGYLSISNNSATPSLYTGAAGKFVKHLNFNNTSPTTVTDITGPSTTWGQLAMEHHVVHITFSNTLTTIQSNGNIFLAGSADFTPTTNKGSMTLMRVGSKWIEVSRSSG